MNLSAGPMIHRGSMFRWCLFAFVLAALVFVQQVEAVPRPVVVHNDIHGRHMPRPMVRRHQGNYEDPSLSMPANQVPGNPRIPISAAHSLQPSQSLTHSQSATRSTSASPSRNVVSSRVVKHSSKSVNTQKMEMAKQVQKTLQQQIDRESVGGGIDINLADILGSMMKDEHLHIEGQLDHVRNHTDKKTTTTVSRQLQNSRISQNIQHASSTMAVPSSASRSNDTTTSRSSNYASVHASPTPSTSVQAMDDEDCDEEQDSVVKQLSAPAVSVNEEDCEDDAPSIPVAKDDNCEEDVLESGKSTVSKAHENKSQSDVSANQSASPQQKSSKKPGFYRIGIETGAKPLPIDVSTGGRVAQVTSGEADEPHGNLPNQSVITNNPAYGFLEAQDDLFRVRKWAGDLGQLVSKENRNETLMALFDAASRYYPDIDTKAVVRIMLADIKAESDFQSGQVSGGRVDSGDSVGLLQVSPGGASQEMSMFKKAAQSKYNTYSWTAGTVSDDELKYGGFSTLGPLLVFETGKELQMEDLSNNDLTKPWINIHVAMWIQSNLGRTSSQDPSVWGQIASKSQSVRDKIAPAMKKIITEVTKSSDDNAESSDFDQELYNSKLDDLNKALKGSFAQKPSFATALGSWVAGPASGDASGYARSGDDISAQYFSNIGEALSVMYKGDKSHKDKYGKSWLEKIELTPGLVDYAGESA